ncbi:MAG: hypothetical protein ACI9YT_003004 [Halobacteriales archaeon]|jgi:hypothetical protein
MNGLPSDLDTERQPPLSIPFAHFVLGGVVLLVGGAIAGVGSLVAPIRPAGAGTLHLLLAGWVGLTIMGAMTQFVPVWSGTGLHSRRQSVVSLWLVTLGVVALFLAFVIRAYDWLPVGATVLLVGFWLFADNVARTLPPARNLDVTEAHFALALGSLVVASMLGWLLATDFGYRILDPLSRSLPVPVSLHAPQLLLAHLTLTVFGFVLGTIVGALYQLAPMFTQSKTTPLDAHLTHVEMVAFPAGVPLLATGRLVDSPPLAAAGATLLLVGTTAFAVFFARRLWFARVEIDPMLRRYGLVALSLFGWVLLSIPRWVADPLDFYARFGSPGATHLLFVGVFTLTIIATFYHVVPFIVWYHRYSDRLGYEPVPMVDELYDERLAMAEFVFLTLGLAILWGGDALAAPTWVLMIGGNLLGLGVLLFVWNMVGVVWRHRPETFRDIVATLVGRSTA